MVFNTSFFVSAGMSVFSRPMVKSFDKSSSSNLIYTLLRMAPKPPSSSKKSMSLHVIFIDTTSGCEFEDKAGLSK